MGLAIGGNQINKAYLGSTEIQKMYLGSELVYGGEPEPLQIPTGIQLDLIENPIQPSGSTPVLSNFRIESAEPSRVLFDASLSIAGMTKAGFIISGYLNSEITLTIDGDNLGGYFTVTEAFTFWDNNTIRLGEVTDTSDIQTVLHNFSLDWIVNNIPEPTASTNRFVNDSASGGDGLSDGTAWTYAEGMANIQGGQTLWIKIGDYSVSGSINLANSGTIDSPIKIIGYKVTEGDITDNYYSIPTDASLAPSLNSSEMPLITGDGTNYALYIYTNGGNHIGRQYVILKNLQYANNNYSVVADNGLGIIAENCNFYDNGQGLRMQTYSSTQITDDFLPVTNYRSIKCVSVNNADQNIIVGGSGNLIDNSEAYCDLNASDPSDYYITIYGHENIVTNSRTDRQNTSLAHDGHGIQIRGASKVYTYFGTQNSYNLIQDSYARNTRECFSVRNLYADFNVFKNCEADGYTPSADSYNSSGITFYTSNNYNLFENIKTSNTDQGIVYKQHLENQSGEPDQGQLDETSTGNIIKNCTFKGASTMIQVTSALTGGIAIFSDNKIVNCTFDETPTFAEIEGSSALFSFSGNEIINSSITGITGLLNNWYDTVSIEAMFPTIDYCNFFDNTMGEGQTLPAPPNPPYFGWDTNSKSVDMNFVDAANGDFTPQATLSSIEVTPLFGVEYDVNDKERNKTLTTLGATMSASEENGGGVIPPVEDSVFEGAVGFGSQWVFDQDYEVRVVTNLDFSGTGSLRDAILTASAKPSVIIVFNGLSGTIQLTDDIPYGGSHQVYIAGQTSENGIVIKGQVDDGIAFALYNTTTTGFIMRGITIARGESPAGTNTNNDCLAVQSGSNIIFDHCTFLWGTDENFQMIADAQNITIQNCIIAEALEDVGRLDYPDGHSCGMILGGIDAANRTNNVTLYNNLFSQNVSRNPLVGWVEHIELVNNLSYNAVNNHVHFDDNPGVTIYANLINNHAIAGDRSNVTKLVTVGIEGTEGIELYVNGNINTKRTSSGQDEWECTSAYGSEPTTPSTSFQSLTAFDYPLKDSPLTTTNELITAQTAVGGVGTFSRNDAEVRIINDVINETGTIIDFPSEVGGYPVIAAGTIITDSNGNGIPDDLEGTWGTDTFGYVNSLTEI